MIADIGFYSAAAFFEIFGCYAFWMAIKLQKGNIWLALGIISLILFAWALAKIDVSFAGKAYAVYGGIYIASSILWLWGIEKVAPTRWDLIGAFISILGAAIIFLNSKGDVT
jgi:small multidrug resistance family-3 protein